MDVTILLIRLLLAAVFSVAGIGKLMDLDGSEKAVKEFGVPDELATPLSFMLPGVELLAAFLLLTVTTSWFGAIIATALLAAFIVGMLVQMAKGNAPDCHCFGAIHSEPVSKKSIARNAVFAGLALVLVARGANGQGAGIADFGNEMVIQFLIGIATIGLLVAVVFYLKKISEQQTAIMRRIEILELVSHEGEKEVKREEAGNPHDSLPIGSVAPDFALPDVAGRDVGLKGLLAAGKPMLLLFVGPNCSPCQALLPEFEQWQADFGDRLEFVYVSTGDAKANAEKFGGGAFKKILLQKKMEVGELFYAKWTPTAVLINADGLVASRLAVGDKGIRDLVDAIRELDLAGPDVFVRDSADSKLGAEAPDFSLTDIDGRRVTSKDFIGKRTLVAFWSTTCPHCQRMADELAAWDRERGADEPGLLVFSKGEPEENRKIGLKSPVLLEEDYKTAEKFGMYGTPSAVLVDEKGRIVSETATGAGNIWALLGKRKL